MKAILNWLKKKFLSGFTQEAVASPVSTQDVYKNQVTSNRKPTKVRTQTGYISGNPEIK